MHRTRISLPSSEGSITLHGYHWTPDGTVRGVLQIAHGMVEHIGRYDEFARFLAGHGFAVLGTDHLGHGDSVGASGERGFFAEEKGDAALIRDMHRVTVLAKKLHPGVPVFLLGHSMGSFLLRRYITLYGRELSGAVICGTGSITSGEAGLGLRLANLLIRFRGAHFRSRLMNLMAIGQYAMQYGNRRRPGSWLSKNTESVRDYAEDPRCGFLFTVGAYRDFFRILKSLAEEKDFERIPRELPLLMISGMEDPLGGYSRKVLEVYNRFVEMGMKDLDIYLYRDDRHEILQETDRDKVFSDVLCWMEERV